jgi:hypothetical protein
MYLENKNKSILLAIGEPQVYMGPWVYDKTLKIQIQFVCKTYMGTVSAGIGMVSLGPTRSVRAEPYIFSTSPYKCANPLFRTYFPILTP